MKKLKMIVTLVLTFGLVLLCATLPKHAAMFMDRQAGTAPVYNDICPVDLELKGSKEELPIFAKLSLCGKGKTAYIESFHATRTEDQIVNCVNLFLGACQKGGFYKKFKPSTEVVTAKLLYDPNDVSNSIIVWTYYAFKTNPNEELHIMIDDETGKILSVSYHPYGSYSMNGIWERNREILDAFTDVYFAHLGLTESAEIAEASPEILYEYLETDMGVTYANYTLSDPTYGTLQINFTAGGVGVFAAKPKT